jgi:hypothetical protein
MATTTRGRFHEIDGVRYSADRDMKSGMWIIRGHRPARVSYEEVMPLPAVWNPNDPEEEIEFSVVCNQRKVEVPQLTRSLTVSWAELQRFGLPGEDEYTTAMRIGIERMRPFFDPDADPEAAARQAEADRLYELEIQAQIERENERKRKILEARRIEEEKKAREQDELESLDCYGMF